MQDLIEALGILAKHMDERQLEYPTHCEHEVMLVSCEEPLSEAEAERLNELGFEYAEQYEGPEALGGGRGWYSYRFGSA